MEIQFVYYALAFAKLVKVHLISVWVVIVPSIDIWVVISVSVLMDSMMLD